MKRRWGWRGTCALLVPFLLLWGLCGPWPVGTHLLRSVSATADGRSQREHEIALHALTCAEFVVNDGRLFLWVQTTRPANVGVTYLQSKLWDRPAIMKLRAAHPELESYWPDPTREDGGVAWLRR